MRRWFWSLTWFALVRQARSRTAVLAAALSAAVLLAASSLYAHAGARVGRDLRAYGANLLVTGATPSSPLDEGRLARALAGLDPARRVGAAPYLQGTATMARPGGARASRSVRVPLLGADLAGFRAVKPSLLVEGRWPGHPDEALVGTAAAAQLNLEPGDAVLLRGTGHSEPAGTVTVSGLLIGGGDEEDLVVVALPAAQRLLGRAGAVDGALVSLVARAPELEQAARAVQRADPELSAVPRAQVARSEEAVGRSLAVFFALVTAALGLAAVLCLATTMLAMIAARQPEIGLKKALGASARAVRAEFLAEAALLGLAGGLLGIPMGWWLAAGLGQVAFGAATPPPWVAVGLALVWTTLATVLATAWPVARAAVLRPITTLRG